MLLKQEYLSSEQNSSLIDLSHYNCDLLAGLVSQPGVSAEAVLLRVNKEVGKVLIRYLSQMGSPDLQHCLRRDRVVDYVIENNIELHDDQVDYALHEKLANNIQKYMAIIRSFQIKNRY